MYFWLKWQSKAWNKHLQIIELVVVILMFSALAFRVFTLHGLKADGLIEGQKARAFKGVGKLKYLFFFCCANRNE